MKNRFQLLFHFIYFYQGNLVSCIYICILSMCLNLCFFHSKILSYTNYYYKCCTVFIRSSTLFFELTYMLLQNNCINNGVNNGLKALYGEIKERKSEWLIGANTENMSYLSIVATQLKTKQRRVRRLLIRVKACRRAGTNQQWVRRASA